MNFAALLVGLQRSFGAVIPWCMNKCLEKSTNAFLVHSLPSLAVSWKGGTNWVHQTTSQWRCLSNWLYFTFKKHLTDLRCNFSRGFNSLFWFKKCSIYISFFFLQIYFYMFVCAYTYMHIQVPSGVLCPILGSPVQVGCRAVRPQRWSEG